MDLLKLPAIDLKAPEDVIVKNFAEQMGTLGFLCIKNIDGFDEDRMLSGCRDFHSISDNEKRKLMCKSHNPENKNIYRGLSPFIDNDESHKEFFDMGVSMDEISDEERKHPLYEKTPFPANHEQLHELYVKEFKHRFALGLQLTRYIALALGLDRNYFEQFFTNSLSTFRTIYYKPRSKSSVKQERLSEQSLRLTTPEHTDSGFLTILSTLGYEGLQVLHNGVYRSVPPTRNELIVNFGDMLSMITNHQVKATKHRVLDIGIERFSNPFFF
jgi:isopenicillin N synthase-like dioxygenase